MAVSQFAGAAGQYHVAYNLSVRNIHAAITLGNAPDIDMLASNIDGSRLLSIQVKTSQSAYRKKRYGFELCEWDVNARIIGRGSPSLWFAFVDLQKDDGTWNPRTFIVPSIWVASFVKPDWSRKMYLLRSSLWGECHAISGRRRSRDHGMVLHSSRRRIGLGLATKRDSVCSKS